MHVEGRLSLSLYSVHGKVARRGMSLAEASDVLRVVSTAIMLMMWLCFD